MTQSTAFYAAHDPNKAKYTICIIGLVPGVITHIFLETTKAVSMPIVYVVVVVFISVFALYLLFGYGREYVFEINGMAKMTVGKGYLWQRKTIETRHIEMRGYILRSYEDSLFEVVVVDAEDGSGIELVAGTSRGMEKKTIEIEKKLKSIGMQMVVTGDSQQLSRIAHV